MLDHPDLRPHEMMQHDRYVPKGCSTFIKWLIVLVCRKFLKFWAQSYLLGVPVCLRFHYASPGDMMLTILTGYRGWVSQQGRNR